jgi:hypothetical protein
MKNSYHASMLKKAKPVEKTKIYELSPGSYNLKMGLIRKLMLTGCKCSIYSFIINAVDFTHSQNPIISHASGVSA